MCNASIFVPIMNTTKQRVVSGIRPTGYLHLGNYFGAMRNYVSMQHEYDCYFFVADWHSLTTHPDTVALRNSVHRVIAENIACGLDPNKVTLYVQSDVPEIAELYLYFNMLAYKGELEKTTTFKDKVRLQPDNINAGLLTYPVLQAADIVIHRAVKVPVGKDQEQHLEMCRTFVQRFNYRYGTQLPEPTAYNNGEQLTKILSLDGVGKMSKSENQMNTIYLADDNESIIKKIKKAKTDAGPAEPNAAMPDYIANLFTLMQIVSTQEVYLKYLTDYNNSTTGNCIIRYGDFKSQLAEDIVQFITPIRNKANELLQDKVQLQNIIEQGKVKARASAQATIRIVRDALGLSL